MQSPGARPAGPVPARDDHVSRLVAPGETRRVRSRTSPAPPTRPVELSYAEPHAPGTAAVTRMSLDLSKDAVVISGSAAVQFNEHLFTLRDPTISVTDPFAGNVKAKEAFGRLVDNPRSRPAGRALQRTLRDGPAWTGGEVKAGKFARPGLRRVSVRPADGGPVVVTRSSGVALGDHGIQRNTFRYEVARARLLSTEPAALPTANPPR